MRHFSVAIFFVFLITITFSSPAIANYKGVKEEKAAVNKTLAILESNLDSKANKIGDTVNVKTKEDLTLSPDLTIPSGSIVSGHVSKIVNSKRFRFDRDGYIDVAFDQATISNGDVMPVSDYKISSIVACKYHKSNKRKLIEKTSLITVYPGTVIPLYLATGLSGGVIYAITNGANVLTGAVTGAIVPDPGRSRLRSSFTRAFEVTPIGIVTRFVTKGYEAKLNQGDGILLTFKSQQASKL